VKTFEAGVYSA